MDTNSSFHPSLSANIPALITNLDQWLVWKSQPRIGLQNKFTKVPYNLRTALPSDATSADTWATFDQVSQATGYDGIGFAINDPIGLLLIDLDNCIVDGVIQEWAEELIQICDTYTEYSPSRLGFHLILDGQKLVGKTRFHHNQVEIYDSKRFLTITGEVYPEPKNINDSTADLLFQYLDQISPSVYTIKGQSSVLHQTEVNHPLDRAILAQIQTHPQYSQEWDDLSERDVNLIGLTNFYTGNNFNQTERVLLATEFCRDKWSQLRQHPAIEDQKVTFLRYQIEQNPSNNVYQGELTPLYRNKEELNQVLLPKFKQWFTSDERRIDVVAVTPGGGKTYTATQALVDCCRDDENFVGILAQNTNQRVSQEVESILDHFEFEASIIQGRTPKESSTGYCRNFQLVDKFNQANLSASRYVCRSACQFRAECETNGYLSQFNRNSQLYLAPYESAINWATYYGQPNVIVFDENPMRPATIEQKLTFEDLSQYEQQMLAISDQDYTYATKFISVLKILLGRHNKEANNSKNKSKNKARNFHRGQQVRRSFADCLQEFYGNQDLDSLYNDRISWRQELVDCNQQMLIKDSPALLVAKTVLDVFDALTIPPEHTEITLKKKKEKQAEDECCLQLNRFHNYINQLPEHTHLLILDAYADQTTFSPLFNPQEIQYHQHQMKTKWQKKIRIHRNTGKSQVRKMDDQEIANIFGKFFEEFKP